MALGVVGGNNDTRIAVSPSGALDNATRIRLSLGGLLPSRARFRFAGYLNDTIRHFIRQITH
jgi:hypothetical protein